ncbi:hypothetical protein [Microbacterium kyungheense]|uniref:HEPN domain-containing protein n=1 Tax=Microbacterium kyungheense TaxID=1263636 RepID=A0A543FJN0_9MICO|nr:hypothetical protein [Microbacterium kyungheense]TQM34083.1 hypothetical protein FB391_0370 [Microbacterium kyungheense]
MTPKNQRTKDCSPTERAGRMQQAEGFWQDAEDLRELGEASPNSVVTLYVHAGIAAADVICCAKLGEYSNSANHNEAITLLQKGDASLAPSLARLVGMKSAAGYGANPVSAQRVTTARSAAEKLVVAARAV